MKRRQIVMGTATAEDFSKRFVDAWERAERSEATEDTQERVYALDAEEDELQPRGTEWRQN